MILSSVKNNNKYATAGEKNDEIMDFNRYKGVKFQGLISSLYKVDDRSKS
jgi:hypothetical protein